MKNKKQIDRMIGLATILLTVLALAQELRKPTSEREWHGRIIGVPYDFRPPTLSRIKHAWWQPESSAVFTDRAFGLGWDINLWQLVRALDYARHTLRAPY